MAKVPMTQAGFDKLMAELENLTKVQLPEIIEKVAEARSHGDLKENSEYHSARERQGHIQDKMKYLEDRLGSAQIIEITGETDTIMFGSKVTTVDPDDEDDIDEHEVFTLVGQDEADPTEGMISVTSPMGQALLGKKAGDIAVVTAPAGTYKLKIIAFE